MTRLAKLQGMTAEQLSEVLISLDENGEWRPMLMPPGLVEDCDYIDDAIKAQADWLCGEYQDNDF